AVDKLVPQANGIYLENIFGERRLVNAYISSMELVQHKIILAQV
ncbi:MAG: CooT family nickel-binding protein, partial [Burkholderiales bacterium]|nr:CooT family nickel-binding protein [Burkholderiales bacterium]